MNHAFPRTSPQSYRFQIWSFTENALPLGGVERVLGELLWEEPPGRECDWEVKHRVASAMTKADELAVETGARVACGTKEMFDSSEFTACYFTRGPFRSALDSRDALLLTAEGGAS